MNKLSEKELHILQHSLWLDKYACGRCYRNYFVTGPESDDFLICNKLSKRGLMLNNGKYNELTGGNYLFTVTEYGKNQVNVNSPEPPKLTRSQRRYRDWLNSGCDLSFGDFLRRRAYD